MAIVDDQPGVTRDWREGDAKLFNLRFRLLDTAGLENIRTRGSLAERTAAQTKKALAQASVILFMIDGKIGLTEQDKTIAREVRKTGKPVILLINKCEGSKPPDGFAEAAGLGFDPTIALSAAHGEGLSELHDCLKNCASQNGETIVEVETISKWAERRASHKKVLAAKAKLAAAEKALKEASPQSPQEAAEIIEGAADGRTKTQQSVSKSPSQKSAAQKTAEKTNQTSQADLSEDTEDDEFEDEDDLTLALHITVTGRPNAGKSTLINSLIGEDRMLTGPEPGLTRDSIPIGWSYKEKPVRLVDTAGMRRRARIEEKLEKLSVGESLRAIRLAHVVILVIDADQPFDKQDYTIAQHVAEEGRALVVAINKWDKVTHKTEMLKMIQAKIEASLAQLSGVPLVTISALNKSGLDKLMREVLHIYSIWTKRISTGKLNRWLEGMQADHPPPIVSGRRVKIRYMTQVKSRPPTFALFVNKPIDLPDSYLRFLTNGLRKTFNLNGVPIRWTLKKNDNPFENKRKRN